MKTFIYLICYLIYPFSFLVPRSKERWAFGSFRGAFNDNAKYLFIEASKKYGDKNIVWISQDRATVSLIRSLGLKAYWLLSPRGVWYALRSKYWFFNSYTSDIMFALSGRAVCINLWHGLMLKRIEFNIERGELADRFCRKTFKERFYHPESYRRPDYVLSASYEQTVKFASAFRVSEERCLEFGYPRNKILRASDPDIVSFVEKYEPQSTKILIDRLKQSSYKRIFIYMPTWRDSQRDVFSKSLDLVEINDVLRQKDSLLLLKPHANTLINKELVDDMSNIVLIDSKADIYPILPYTDVLITDYSSILYDYILMEDKDVILYVYDLEEYASTRDFTYPFSQSVTGKIVYSFSQLKEAILKEDFISNSNERDTIIRKFWGNTSDINSSQRIFDFVKQLK